MADENALAGARVMIVEDEMLVAILVEDYLTDEGCVVVGPAATVADAMKLVGSCALDAAVMDVNIGGEKIYAVAEALDRRGVPFLIVSGYGQTAIPVDRPKWRVCAKPFRGEEMVAMLRAQVQGKREALL